jgi:triosephosphate isomerase
MTSENSKLPPLLAGNWKMNGLRAALAEIRALGRGLADVSGGEVLICPPATLISEAVRAAEGTRIAIGGQDCHAKPSGAYTGDVSAPMLRDLGASYVIVGHSERRQYHGESDTEVAAKVAAARGADLKVILCVGESESVRAEGNAEAFVSSQLASSLPENCEPDEITIAYEPVWAIGSGRTPTSAQIAGMHSAIRVALSSRFGGAASGKNRILYGGSVNPGNAESILTVPGVDGALVGGASLKAADFLSIIRAAAVRK